ncbi:unnamed protein product [Ranitomeya imitator]|uniref:DNA-dependent protein kinase catalytic subunit CC3 domain-containing protein n=1 Tax=Ranitomeya imitator TaxID=111125 RepID=A0ABN9LX78_9NEOB|nr:unnamed protein product [Ranitomeya imitator]
MPLKIGVTSEYRFKLGAEDPPPWTKMEGSLLAYRAGERSNNACLQTRGRQSTPAPEPQREDQKRTPSDEDGRHPCGHRHPLDRTVTRTAPGPWGVWNVTFFFLYFFFFPIKDEPQYLSSQSYMADSSLSEEMSQFDFSTGVQSFSYSSQAPVKTQRSRRTQDRSSEAQTPEDFMEFEMDELNQHESMAPMTGLIKHMQKNDFTPKVEEGKMPEDLPPWMTFLHSKLGNPSTPLNIRLFISKLVVNTEEVFRPYAKFWIGPILQLIASGNNGGTGIHYMVVETVVTLLSWSGVATPTGMTKEEILANRLLEFMMKNSFHEKRAVYRHNLEIIKTVLECWKDCLCIPYSNEYAAPPLWEWSGVHIHYCNERYHVTAQCWKKLSVPREPGTCRDRTRSRLLYDCFSGTDPNTKDNSVGIQLLGLVVANSFSPYDPKCEIDSDRYFQALANNVTFTRFKEVYAAASEVLGLVLRHFAEKEKVGEACVSCDLLAFMHMVMLCI